jgi:protein-tyrosine phosphatase
MSATNAMAPDPLPTSPAPLSAPQLARLAKFHAKRAVDIHCHCLAAIDDGPRNAAESLAVCRLLARDGFTDVIATPHQLGRYDGLNWAAEIRGAVAHLQQMLDRERVPLRVHAGGEVRIDERIPKLLADGKLLTLGDSGRYLLLELPNSMHIAPEMVMRLIQQGAATTTTTGGVAQSQSMPPYIVLAHAERYDALRRDPAAAEAWVHVGAILQVNAPSLLGDGPPDSRAAAMQWLADGWVSVIATDAHSPNTRRPRMTEAIDLIEREFGIDVAQEVCIDNPAELLLGAHPHE